jgi:hypothetical protein
LAINVLNRCRLNKSCSTSFVLKNCLEIKQVEKFASDIVDNGVRSTERNQEVER